MEIDEPVPIYTVQDFTKAELIRNLLHSEGIVCETSGQTQGGFTGIIEIQILTRAEDADRALKLIREHEAHLTESDAETEEEDEE